MNSASNQATDEIEVPDDLARLIELTVSQSHARHREARERLEALIGSQDKGTSDTINRFRQLVIETIRRGEDQIEARKDLCRRKIADLEDDARLHRLRIPSRRKWLFIFERDNERYYTEKAIIDRELTETDQALEPALDEINRETEAEISKIRLKACVELENLKAQQNATLHSFQEEESKRTGEIDAGIEMLKGMGMSLPDIPDGLRPVHFIRTGSIRFRLTKWDQSDPVEQSVPWLHPAAPDAGLVVCGNADVVFSWVHGWIFGMLNAYPPGLLRLTLIDSEQLGKPFTRWLELGDSSADLLGGKVWTEAREIEARLIQLKEHVVRVTQRILRDEFANIQEYNEARPEAPEPVHLVVIHQPASGSRGAVAELIAQLFVNGPRCGVIPCLIQTAGSETRPDMLEAARFHSLLFRQGGFVSGSLLRVTKEVSPAWVPNPECGSMKPTRRLREIAAEAARRSAVSVDYEGLLREAGAGFPEAAATTLDGITVPVGRSETGAIVRVEFGTTSGHHNMLVGGRPGSGKSTFLHSIIITSCRMHSPEELQIYLLDYKRGTEFMPYASDRLPHARVVAVESDREFGLSVLNYLDKELTRRSALFKSFGVQGLSEYRRTSGDTLPRMLLVIDEFQVLFKDKDSLADEASRTLDDLIRQGRSYGLHVILATQVFCTGWSLSANTLSLISSRVALASDERVSRQILGEDNKAAQHLTRPGEAIYNDKNGQPLGNNRFQVVDFRRDELGDHIQSIRANFGDATYECTVFDGAVSPDGAAGLARFSPNGSRGVEILLGLSSELGLAASVCLERRSGQNLVVFSESPRIRAMHLLSIAESLRLLVAETVFVDAAVGSGAITCHSESLESLDRLDSSDLPRLLARLRCDCEEPDAGTSVKPDARLIIIHFPHSIPALCAAPLQLARNPPGTGTASDFEWLLRHGPASGIHFILIEDRPGSFSHGIDPRGKLIDLIDLRAATRLSEAEARKVFPDAKAARLDNASGIFHSRTSGTSLKYRPFEWPQAETD